MPKLCHRLIGKRAVEIACDAYEAMAHSNEFFKEWPSRNRFATVNWPMFVPLAREALIKDLDNDLLPNARREEIYDALLFDGAIKADPTPLVGIH